MYNQKLAHYAHQLRTMPAAVGQGVRSKALQLIGAVALAALTSGCVTVANSLSQETVKSLKLVGTQVTFTPDARVHWGDGIRAFGVAKNVPDHELVYAADTEEARKFVKSLLGTKVKEGVEQALAGELAGKRPVKLDIVVKQFNIASAFQRIVIGGGHGMTADVTLRDAQTGKVIVAYPDLNALSLAGNGIAGTLIDAAIMPDPTKRLIDGFAGKYRDWLAQKSA